MKPSSAPLGRGGSSSEESHRWFGQIKTRLNKTRFWMSVIHFWALSLIVLAQKRWEHFRNTGPNQGLQGGKYKPTWMFHVGAFLLPNVLFGLVCIPWILTNLGVGAQKLPSRKFSTTSEQNYCTVDLNVAFINTAVSRWVLLKAKHKVKEKVTSQLKGTEVWGNWKLTMATQNQQIKLLGFKSFKNPLIQKKEINPWKPSNKNCNYHCQ